MRVTLATGLAFGVLLVSACSRAPDSPPNTGNPAIDTPKPAVASSPEAEKELRALQGKWIFVEEEREGKPTKIPEAGQDTLTITGTEYAEVLKPAGITFAGMIDVDPTHKPKTIVVHLSNATPGEIVTKAYELAGDTLRMVTVYMGNKVPAEVSSKEPGTAVKIYTRKK